MNSSILLERFGINPINFKGRELELIKNDNDEYVYYCEESTEKIPCPICNGTHIVIHDYYKRIIHVSTNMYQTDEIIVKRVRFKCKKCNKTFTREIEGIDNKEQISHNTKRLM